MIDTNSTFDTKNTALQKKPVVVIEFTGYTNDYSTGTYSSIPATVKKYLQRVTIKGGEVDLTGFKFSAAGVDFVVIDKDRTFLGEMASDNVIGNNITVKIGFQDIAIGNFVTLSDTYRIVDFDVDPDTLKYTIRARDARFKQLTDRNLFRLFNHTFITADHTAAVGTITVQATAGFLAGNSADWGNETKTYIRIDNEIIEYTAIGGANTFNPIVRGALGTTASDHADGSQVDEIYVIHDNPFDFLVQLLTGYKYDADWAASTALPAWFGLDLDKDNDIDVFLIDSERRKWDFPGEDWEFYWIIDKEWNAEEFIVENILKILPAYFYITKRAKLAIKVWDLYTLNEGKDHTTWEDDNFDPKVKSTDKDLVTDVTYYSDFDGAAQSHNDSDEHNVTEITTKYSRRKTVEVRPFCNGDNAGADIPTDHLDRMLERYFKNSVWGNTKINGNAYLEKWIHQVGDIIDFNNAKCPNIRGNSITWTNETIILLKILADIGLDEARVQFEGINYNGLPICAAAGSSIGHEVANETDVDDTSFDLASDAHYAVDTLTDADEVRVLVEATLPNNADAVESYDLNIIGREVGVADDTQNKRIYYNSSWSGTIQREFYLFRDGSATTWERIVCRGTAESAGAGNKLTSLTMKQVRLIKYNWTKSW